MERLLSLFLLCPALFLTTVTSHEDNVCIRPNVGDNIVIAGLQRYYNPGEELALSCKEGHYPLSGPLKTVCTVSGQWTKTKLLCMPKRCPYPEPLPNGEAYFENAFYQSTINYTCQEGYVLNGSNTAVCQANGTWSTLVPECTPKMCPIPRALQPLAMGRTEAPFKTVLNFSCDDGYVMQGANESRCLHDGTWSHPPPTCKAVNCPMARPPRDGRIVHDTPVTGTTTMYGQGWTYECNPPKAPSYERGSCRADGTVPEPPVCREVSCSIPTNIPNGVITFAVMRPHGYKEKVKYACNEHYVLDGKAEIQCQNTGNWSSQPVCRAPCTVGIKRGRIFYNAKKIWIADLKPNRVLHGEHVAFYCLNRADRCGYPVVSTCNDGSLPIPECFEEPGKVDYNLRAKTLPSEIAMCATAPPANPTSSARPA